MIRTSSTGIQWAAGMSVSGVPDNPYPADIINLSLGGSGGCGSNYTSLVNSLTSMGVLVVASAGNESGPVDAPGNCRGSARRGRIAQCGHEGGLQQFGTRSGSWGTGW